MISELESQVNIFHETIKEVMDQLDPESAKIFLEEFNKKMKELYEQTNLQKDPGASR